ncbi:MAG: DNA-protecting protein DprA [Coprococcus sp.]|nr:DNA-protecting protein DprA [Coprococcus sp.]
MEEEYYEYWFANVEGIRADRKRSIRKCIGSAKAIYNIEETILSAPLRENLSDREVSKIKESRKKKDWKKEYAHLAEKGIRFIPWHSPDYPARFDSLPGMPYALYLKGHLPKEERISAAIVGARRCSAYGERMTLEFAEALAEAGIQIISGMARGIDGFAHRGALNVGGMTCAVLGCGTDICYPREHKGLYQDLERKGGIVSEFPPGTPPLPSNFPARNRIISALADIVLVMEAREKSGSLITADLALEQGRDVYALPGPVTEELSRGTNNLIRQGAGILLNPQEMLDELGIQSKKEEEKEGTDTDRKKGKNKIMLESIENLVYSKLGLYPRNQEELLQEAHLAPQELAGILVSLELKGYISEVSKNYYIRRV